MRTMTRPTTTVRNEVDSRKVVGEEAYQLVPGKRKVEGQEDDVKAFDATEAGKSSVG